MKALRNRIQAAFFVTIIASAFGAVGCDDLGFDGGYGYLGDSGGYYDDFPQDPDVFDGQVEDFIDTIREDY